MQTFFSTNEYFFNHGKMPRGRGTWAFEFDFDKTPYFAPSSLLFTEAKRAAVHEACKRIQARIQRKEWRMPPSLLMVKVLP
jgi:hypothetical protein